MTPLSPRHRHLVRLLARYLDREWMADRPRLAWAELVEDAGVHPGIQEASGPWDGEPGGKDLERHHTGPVLLDPDGNVIP